MAMCSIACLSTESLLQRRAFVQWLKADYAEAVDDGVQLCNRFCNARA
jgi:hypothetical protein